MYQKLFKNISKRFSSENSLSDITWAFAQSSEIFRFYFLSFFFKDFSDKETIYTFVREYTRNDSRPDFFIETDKKEYIIECKIFDRNHHFEQYQNSFPNAEFGYIANYKVLGKENIFIKSWPEFYEYLNTKISTLESKEDITFINSYSAYLKSVCFIPNLKVMRIDTLSSLHSLSGIIRKILNDTEQFGEIEYDGKIRNIDEYRYGKYFGIKKIGSEKKIWPWIGVYFNEDYVMLYVEINKEWCNTAFEFLKSHPDLKEGNYFYTPYLDDDYRPSYCFEFKEEYFKSLNLMTETKEQESLIKNFIDEVFEFLNNQF